MIELSQEQKDVVELPLGPIAVTACAGSGKTRTAVHRLAQMRSRLKDDRGIVALLSFSNVAVDTFRNDYRELLAVNDSCRRVSGIEIDTVDGFIVSNILRPHGHRVMDCSRTPYLVEGREPFLSSFSVYDGTRSHPISQLRTRCTASKLEFGLGNHFQPVNASFASAALAKLGKHGAYTHAAAPYWVLKLLRAFPALLNAFARRYPQILVDEAQDIGPLHEEILQTLVKAGSVVSLIGDANQGIYEFSGADGSFLNRYGSIAGVTVRNLSSNFRSVPPILHIANALCGRKDQPERSAPETLHGAFYFPFEAGGRDAALGVFRNLMAAAKIAHSRCAVLCRSSEWASEWAGLGEEQGQGIVRWFAEAVIHRDRHGRMDKAFECACAGIIGLLEDRYQGLAARLLRGPLTSETTSLRRTIWSFVRDTTNGLPDGKLLAASEWHPLLGPRVRSLLARLATDHGMATGSNLGQRLANRALENRPLVEVPNLIEPHAPKLRVCTVHKAKGESIDAVMYVVNKSQATNLLDGPITEVGRIGYVALTRARNLFVLAIPKNAMKDLEPRLKTIGFKRAGNP